MAPSVSMRRLPGVPRPPFWPGMTPPYPSWPISRQPFQKPSPTASSTLTLAVYPGRLVRITVADKGIGIPDIPKAMEPLFTTGNPEERSGLGFAVMQSFMDKVTVHSVPGRGTRVTLTKRLDERASST